MDSKLSVKAKNRLFKLLPKPFSALRLICSPCSQYYGKKAFEAGSPGPKGTMTAHQKIKNPSNLSAHEPTSPKISCIGQIKHKRKICKERRLPLPKESSLKTTKKSSSILNVFGFGKQKSNDSNDHQKANLGQVKKYVSCRDSFANFDCTAQIAPVESDGDGVDESTVSPSVDMVMTGRVNLKPRQEINLWKRRTMAQPKPLKLNTTVL